MVESSDVDQFLESIADEQRKADCLEVLALMKSLTRESPKMWGKAMVGFGCFRYRGKTTEADWFHIGFSPRKQNLTLYLHCDLANQNDLLEKLGKHKVGKSCLYLKKFEDAHLPTLKKLITKAYKKPAIPGAEII